VRRRDLAVAFLLACPGAVLDNLDPRITSAAVNPGR
jgi:hypothetical protein